MVQIPIMRRSGYGGTETDTEETIEAPGLDTLACTAAENKGTCLKKVEDQD